MLAQREVHAIGRARPERADEKARAPPADLHRRAAVVRRRDVTAIRATVKRKLRVPSPRPANAVRRREARDRAARKLPRVPKLRVPVPRATVMPGVVPRRFLAVQRINQDAGALVAPVLLVRSTRHSAEPRRTTALFTVPSKNTLSETPVPAGIFACTPFPQDKSFIQPGLSHKHRRK